MSSSSNLEITLAALVRFELSSVVRGLYKLSLETLAFSSTLTDVKKVDKNTLYHHLVNNDIFF